MPHARLFSPYHHCPAASLPPTTPVFPHALTAGAPPGGGAGKGKKRRITFIECPQDLHGMLDAAKYADLVLLLIDGSYGFEMETFEFLNLLQARFWTEIYDGAKLFYLSGIQHGKYLKREVLNLARFISVMKTRPLTWRLAHPYVIADRMEDITPRERVRVQPKCDREVVLYGYLRGANLKAGARVHLAGVGDFNLQVRPAGREGSGRGPAGRKGSG
ncbi:Bms1-type G domain-containing protein [Haematococcus lacustris]|uniref:Bms1-type G domain-containing protein n=1 Tax=Haematococcus lacustris TaxID=44745 RepID=A0A699YHF8_HAELA|nr:Bms1-type G domain-containing protein [Haematococcus lacustris]